MKHRKYILPLFVLLLIFSTTTACSQRRPRPESAKSAIKSYFKSYGKKYKESDFGEHKLDEIEVSEIIELQHGMALVEAYVSLSDGDIVYKVGATLLKKTLFWRVISWENLGKAT